MSTNGKVRVLIGFLSIAALVCVLVILTRDDRDPDFIQIPLEPSIASDKAVACSGEPPKKSLKGPLNSLENQPSGESLDIYGTKDDEEEALEWTRFKGVVEARESQLPIEGASVELWPRLSLWKTPPPTPIFKTTTDEKGVFLAPRVPLNRFFTLYVKAAGRARKFTSVFIKSRDRGIMFLSDRECTLVGVKRGEDAFLRVVLGFGARVSGVVYDLSGNCVAEAEVYALSQENLKDRRGFWYTSEHIPKVIREIQSRKGVPLRSLRTTTDQNGCYEITRLPADGMQFKLCAIDKEGFFGTTEYLASLKDQGHLTQNIVIQSRSLLEIVVVDSDGKPVPGIKVEIRDHLLHMAICPISIEHTTDARGMCREMSLGRGPYWICIWPEKYEPLYKFIEMDDAGTERVKIELRPGRRLSGLVVDESDRPIKGALVRLRWDSTHPNPLEKTTLDSNIETDEKGRFSRLGIPKDGVSIRVRATGKCDARVVVNAGEEEVRIVLKKFPVFIGRLDPTHYSEFPRMIQIAFGHMELHTSSFHRLGKQGRFLISLDDYRKIPVYVYLSLDGWTAPPLGPFSPKPGETVDLGVIAPSPKKGISGVLLTPKGLPCPNATIRIFFPLNPRVQPTTTTNAKGIFQALIPQWRCRIVAEHPDYPAILVEVATEDSKPVQIRFSSGGFIKGTVVDSQGNPSRNQRVHFQQIRPDGTLGPWVGGFKLFDIENINIGRLPWWQKEGFAKYNPEVDEHGMFTSPALPPGRYQIVVAPAYHCRYTYVPGPAVDVKAGETKVVNVEITRKK